MALIKKLFGVDAVMRAGARGQFDVLVNGEVVCRRGGNAITRKFGAGYPDFEQVAALIEKARE